jgi:histidyl-tRNA synthetase
VLREVDKLDKRGEDAVRATLMGEGFALSGDVIDRLMAFARVRDRARRRAGETGRARAGLRCSRKAATSCVRSCSQLKALGVAESRYALNLSIARGLDYYTGMVYETTLDAYPQIGSICSGGRYENLAGHYTKSKLPGVGISIGLTRLFWQLRTLDWSIPPRVRSTCWSRCWTITACRMRWACRSACARPV